MNKTFFAGAAVALLITLTIGISACSGAETANPPPPPLPPRVPAAPNDSIVTARVIAVDRLDNQNWEIVIDVQKAENIPGMINALSGRVSDQMVVRTSEDVSQIQRGQVITANVRLVGDERSHFFIASGIRIP